MSSGNEMSPASKILSQISQEIIANSMADHDREFETELLDMGIQRPDGVSRLDYFHAAAMIPNLRVMRTSEDMAAAPEEWKRRQEMRILQYLKKKVQLGILPPQALEAGHQITEDEYREIEELNIDYGGRE